MGMKKNGRQAVSLSPFHLVLQPIASCGTWSARLERDVVTLYNAENKQVLIVPRDEVASHVRFAWDVFRGRTVSFVPFPGMKPYTFRCGKATFEKLRGWLPSKSPEETANEVRLNAIAVALFGIFFLMRYVDFHWIWGLTFLAAGAIGIFYPKRSLYLLNGLVMFSFVIGQIVVAGGFGGPGPGAIYETSQLMSVIAICVFACWSVQQLSMLQANAQVRAARLRGMADAFAIPAGSSMLVRTIGRAALITSITLWIYIAGVMAVRALDLYTTDTADPTWISQGRADQVVLPVLAVFTLLAGIYLMRRKRPAYFDARIVAQVLIVIVVCALWGLLGIFRPTAPLSFFGPLLTSGGFMLLKPYAWITLLILVIGFNRWFSKAMDAELEQALESRRDQTAQ